MDHSSVSINQAIAAAQNVKEREYWHSKMSGQLVKSFFYYDHSDSEGIQREMESHRFVFGGELFDNLMHLSNQYDYTLYMILVGGLTLLLNKYSYERNNDIILGAPIYKQETEGVYINTVLPLRNRLEEGMTFKQLLLQVKDTVSDANKHQNYPFKSLLEHLKIPLSRNECLLFDVAVLLKNIHDKDYLRDIPLNMVLSFERSETGIEGAIEYNAALYRRSTIESIAGHLIRLLEQALAAIDAPVSGIDILLEQDRHQLLVEFNQPAGGFPTDTVIHDLFRLQVERTPNAVALAGVDKGSRSRLIPELHLTYKALDDVTDSLAGYLAGRGAEPGAIVGFLAERSPEMIIGIIAVLKAGCGYLPLNPRSPESRNRFMLEDCNVRLLLSSNKVDWLSGSYIEVVNLSSVSRENCPSSPLTLTSTHPDNTAYVIYTSGSSGKPKGVPISHTNFSPLVNWSYKHMRIGTADRALQNLSYYFDWSVWEIFVNLTAGASLYMVPEEVLMDPATIADFIEKYAITVLHLTPTQCSYLVNLECRLESVKYLCIGAEKLSYQLVKRSFAVTGKNCRVFNMYGPTEATIISAIQEIDRERYKRYRGNSSVPIGPPTGNSGLYILDNQMDLCPPRMPGELYISGEGVASGYLNNPELSAERFLKLNQFDTSQRVYKTGDLARWLPDGSMEFLGRIDQQVKVRGFRIELGEIENRLLAHDAIKEAVVIDREDLQGEIYLCAYIVYIDEIATSDLKSYLARTLPDYMVPSHFTALDKIPLNSNGKLDRKALSPPDTSAEEYIAPRGEIETQLAVIWSEILGLEPDKISAGADFFLVGGHSLKANVLSARIHKHFNVEISLTDIFVNPSIRELAKQIKQSSRSLFQAIEPEGKREEYPLSSAQRRLYVLQLMDNENTAYNLPMVMMLEGELKKTKLEHVFQRLVTRHDSLRTSFHTIDGRQVQKVHESVDASIQYVEAQSMEYKVQSDGQFILEQLPHADLIKDFIRPFDLSQAPLFRVLLIKVADNVYNLAIDMHHIISDGISTGILIDEFSQLYAENELPELRLQYRDFAIWQSRRQSEEAIKQQELFWLNEFREEIPVLELPYDYVRPGIRNFEGNNYSFTLGSGSLAGLKKLADDRGGTLFMALLAVLNIFLAKAGNRESIVVGTSTAGRGHTDLESVIGMFVNTLALKNEPSGEKTVREFLDEVRKNTLAAFENQDFQYEELVEKVSIDRDVGRNPLFDVMLVLQNLDAPEVELPGLIIKPVQFDAGIAKFDLMLQCWEANGGLECNFEYSRSLFKEETIRKFAGFFQRVAAAAALEPDAQLAELEIISGAEREWLLTDFNNTAAGYPRNKTVHELFEAMAECQPEMVALWEPGGNSMTYGELNVKANRLAQRLRDRGVGADSIVGVMVNHSVQLLLGIMGVLKSGSAYLPINPTTPRGRVDYIIKDSAITVLLTDKANASGTGFHGALLNPDEETPYTGNTANRNYPCKSSDIAYVIYTSGSTGRPKGVAVEHRQLVNFLYHMYNRYDGDIGSQDRCLSLTNMMFDVSVWEYFLPLCYGAQLVMLQEEKRFDVFALSNAIMDEAITLIYLPPGLLKDVYNRLNKQSHRVKLNKMLVGVEPIRDDVLEAYMRLTPGIKIINGYGPTETTICCTSIDYESHEPTGEIVPIGVPLSNNQVVLLDRWGNLVPRGFPGELCVSGDGVSRGYLNNPELTAEKYIDINWSSKTYRTYKTGDLARILPNNNIRFMGRRDQQLKIRGYRIELGEIENRLLEHPDISGVFVLVRSDQRSGKYLCAYIISGKSLEASGLRRFLAGFLPEYMIPSYFMQIERLPLTANGKVDRSALPEPETGAGAAVYIAPRDRTESRLVDIMLEIVEPESREPVGIDHNFFELGGHSLKATSLVHHINKTFDVNISIQDIFTGPTVREIAERVKELDRQEFQSIVPVEKREYYELSYAQRRLWVICHFEDESTAYNLPIAYVLKGGFNPGVFERSVQTLVDRHESLRTLFVNIQGRPMQRIRDYAPFHLALEDLRGHAEESKTARARQLHIAFIQQPFKMETGPLFRFKLLRLEDEKYLLFFNIHHIITDGWSQGIMSNEIIALYNTYLRDGSRHLPPLELQYRDYAYWHNDLVNSGRFSGSRKYWLEKFKDKPNGIELPLDHPRKSRQTFNGATIPFSIEAAAAQRLRTLNSEENTTLFMGLLALFDLFLYKNTGQRDIIVGSPIAGRRDRALHRMIGFLVNTLVYRNLLDPSQSFRQFLAGVKHEALESYEHQDYPFDLLVNELDLDRDLSQSPLFNVMMAHNNTDVEDNAIGLDGIAIENYIYGDENNMSVFDLIFHLVESGEKLGGTVMYNTDLFERSTIERMIADFTFLVEQVTDQPDLPMGRLRTVSKIQYETVVNTFNRSRRQFPLHSLQQIFQQVVVQTPYKTALVSLEHGNWESGSGTEHITYGELNCRANRLAHFLKEEYNVKPNDAIGVSMERSIAMIVALLGIIKAGAAYLAVDPAYPRERVLHVLSDSGSRLLVIDKMRPKLFADYPGQILNVVDAGKEIAQKSLLDPPCVNRPQDVLYINYTSGSTGTPNGALLSHDCLTNLINWQNASTSIDCSSKVLQFTSINFCVSFQEIMGALTSGGQIHLIGEIERQDIDYLMGYLSRHRIEILFLPFSYLNFLFNESDRWNREFHHNLKHIITAGEQLKITTGLKRFLDANPNIQVHNHYGSTEMHVVTSFTLDASTAAQTPIPPAGKPIDNVSIYILDENLNPVPVGVWGELFVRGSTEVLGYINNDSLSSEKLVYHRELSSEDSIKLFRSGDIGRWLPDGNIELRGRKDFMVKLRGFRIELGEVESKILAVPQVRECVVAVKEDEKKQKDLFAYVSVEDISAAEIKRAISGELPHYMIPKFVIMDSLPLMPNGKVDRERLPAPREAAVGDDPAARIDPMQVTEYYRQGAGLERVDNKVLVSDSGYLEKTLGIYTGQLKQAFLQEDLDVRSIDVRYETELPEPNTDNFDPLLTAPRTQITDYRQIPLPDRSLITMDHYRKNIGLASVKHTISLQATRGCPYKCLYCHKIWPKNHVYRPAENLYREVKLYYDMGVRRFVFVDDIFNLSKENSTRFFKMLIDNGLDVNMFFSNGLRSDLLTPEYIDLMVEAGTVSLALALETASPRLQKLLRKYMNLDKLRGSLEYFCEKHPNVILELFLMHGFPTETEDEANMTLEFLKALKWVDFPYLNLLKIYPNTDMAQEAMKMGVSADAIARSTQMAYHELPETLPFDKAFTRGYQTEFLNNYFLSKDRLRAKLPHQMRLFAEDEIVQKYNGYLPTEITGFDDLLNLVGISREELTQQECVPDDHYDVPDLDAKIRNHFPGSEPGEDPFKILLLDLSTFFSSEKDILYDEVEPPLGLMYLLTYLRERLGSKVDGKIAKSRVDFDSFHELRLLVNQFKPHLIGIRTLTYYSNFFHNTLAVLRHWGIDVPVVAGGPYASSDYRANLLDPNIDLVVMSEGEVTFTELVSAFIENDFHMPEDEKLKKIAGLAFIPGQVKRGQSEYERTNGIQNDGNGDNGLLGSLFTHTMDSPVPVSLRSAGMVRAPLHLRTSSIHSVEMYRDESVTNSSNCRVPVKLRLVLPEGGWAVPGSAANDSAPETPVEKKLVAIWSDLLGMDPNHIGIDANFFEMGGHSLKATTMMSRIHKEFNVRIKLTEIFKYPSIKEIAALISVEDEAPFSELETVGNRDHYPLSYNQRRLWIINSLEPDNAAYNMPLWLDWNRRFDETVFEKALHEIVQRHESLRTGFKIIDETPVQYVVPTEEVSLPIIRIDISNLAGDKKRRELEQIFADEAGRPFNMMQVPLFRCILVNTGNGACRIVFNMHHIITDGMSQEILKKEFIALYEAYSLDADPQLSPVLFQYKDFAVWQSQQLQDQSVKTWSHKFWKKTLERDLEPVALPYDRASSKPDRSASAYRCIIPGEVKDRLNDLARSNNTSLFTTLLALFNILLSRVSGQQDILLGIPVSGRDHVSLQHVVGFFVNTVVLDTYVDDEISFLSFLDGVNANLMEVFQHQSYPLEAVMEELNIRFPSLNVFFNMFNLDDTLLETQLESLEFYHIDEGTEVKFDIVVYIAEYKNGIELRCDYRKALFNPETIASLMSRFIKVVDYFSAQPEKRVLDFIEASRPVEKRRFKRV